MVAEDAIIMEEVLAEVWWWKTRRWAFKPRKKWVLLQEEKVVEMAVSVATEAQLLREKVGFRGERSGERSSSAPKREGGFSDRAPRRAESTGDAARPRRPRRS